MQRDSEFLKEVKHKQNQKKKRHKLTNGYQITNSKLLIEYFKK